MGKSTTALVGLANLESELFGTSSTAYLREHQETVLQAIREAFAWLESQVLLVPAVGTNVRGGWRVLNRRGGRFTSDQEWQNHNKESLVPQALQHPRRSGRLLTPLPS